MKAKNKFKKILACVVLLISLVASCSYQTLFAASNYVSQASAKSYAAENKTDPYEFESAGKWSRSTNYTSVTVDGNSVNAFDKTTVSQNLATLEAAHIAKPSTLWNGDTTSPSEGKDDNKYKVMMIDAKNADVEQMKDVKDDDGNYVYEEDEDGNPIYETDKDGNIVYYEAANISTSNKKYVPASKEVDGEANVGKYKAKVIKQEMTDIYYFYKSNSLSLSKQSYYVISIWVYTTGDAYASVKVANNAETFDANVENIQTGDQWQKIYMFMETRADGSANTVTFHSTLVTKKQSMV